MKPFLDGLVYFDVNRLHNIAEIKNSLIIESRFNKKNEPPKIITMYDEETKPGFIGVPMRYGLDIIKSLKPNNWQEYILDNSSMGYDVNFENAPDLNHKDAHLAQKEIVPQLVQLLLEKRSTILQAGTGTGKTAMALSSMVALGGSTLIVTHTHNLKEHWASDIEKMLKITREDLGIVKAEKCVIKPITLASLQTLYKPKYHERLRDQFRLIIFDEVHNLGAEEFVKALYCCNARYWLGLSATPKRRDGCDKAFIFALGAPEIKIDADALPMRVDAVPYYSDRPLWGGDRNGKIKCLSLDKKRNKFLIKIIMKMVRANRNVLIIGEYREHLKTLYAECVNQGMDPSKTGHLYGGASEFANFADIFKNRDYVKDAEYFEWVKREAQFIFSTYGSFKEGISVNRLDAGIDVLPRSEAKQVIGRIRRPFEGKKLPIWVTIVDMNDYQIKEYYQSRKKEYKADKAVTLFEHESYS